MGYCTEFTLNVEVPESYGLSPGDIISDLRARHDEAAYAIEEDGSTLDPVKWYEHEKHLVEFSAGHPGVRFTLFGVGEEQTIDSLDVWRLYVRNGKAYREVAMIDWPDFSWDQL